ncbi:TonB family protein [Mucilaginibacter achroorhodeus]|uniref:TonB family protein n=1 Tax=Mucilaginibacter achroorhodeus TaxID=2599294 RepID=A0A563U035_9SPHI|nr:M56 family metallopeptidase [Mucilaginibacter achroorhodeus]TWR25005.1 TonB family protein [Mucilaginibacter achroorhodeus]
MSWWHYLLLVNIYLCLFFCFYGLLLRRETFFQLNRVYLVGTAILSFFIPLIHSDWVQNLFITRQVQYSIYGATAVTIADITPIKDNPLTIGEVLGVLYGIGVLLLIARLLIQLVMLRKVINDPSPKVSYSFFNKIKVGQEIDGHEVIHNHELVHARQFHSADVLIIEAVMIINWFNPIVYLYRNAIKHVHEFIADKHTLDAGTNKADYAMLLLSQTFEAPAHGMVNPFFNHSLLKQRIIMLQKNRSQRIKLIKYGLSAPLFVLMLILSSATISDSKTVETINAKAEAVLETSAKDVINGNTKESNSLMDSFAPGDTASDEATLDTVPKAKVNAVNADFPGGYGAFMKFLASNVKYPAEAKSKNKQGRSVITFMVNADGSLSDFKVAKAVGYGMDEEAVRVLKMSPKWQPATRNGKAIRSQYSVPVSFSLDGNRMSNVKPQGVFTDDAVFTAVEHAPSFPGGDKAFGQFLGKTVKYPKEARENNIQGRVIATFIVEQDGSLSNIRIVRGIGGGADEEAVRMLALSPKWIAGTQNGHKVRVQYSVPINFSLVPDDDGDEKKIGAVPNMQPTKSLLLVDSNKNWISIKGNNHPLYVVDGKRVSTIDKINPKDIKSVTILKDQSATAIYGTDGRSGVVLVTTKAKDKFKIK